MINHFRIIDHRRHTTCLRARILMLLNWMLAHRCTTLQQQTGKSAQILNLTLVLTAGQSGISVDNLVTLTPLIDVV